MLRTRLLHALPDLATAVFCLVVWISPFALGEGATTTVVTMMLVEFFTVQFVGVFAIVALKGPASRGVRAVLVGVLALACLVFVVVVSAWADAWWPALLVAWLAGTKLAWVFASPRDPDALFREQMLLWGIAVAAYFTAVIASIVVPLPPLGLDAAAVERLRWTMRGEWAERPYVAAAALVFYFTVCGVARALVVSRVAVDGRAGRDARGIRNEKARRD